MTTKWNKGDYQLNSNGGNYMEYFKEHNKHMSVFRGAHANVAMVNATRLDDAALLARMEPLRVSLNMIEAGGSALPNDITDRSDLVPMWKVPRYKLSQN